MSNLKMIAEFKNDYKLEAVDSNSTSSGGLVSNLKMITLWKSGCGIEKCSSINGGYGLDTSADCTIKQQHLNT